MMLNSLTLSIPPLRIKLMTVIGLRRVRLTRNDSMRCRLAQQGELNQKVAGRSAFHRWDDCVPVWVSEKEGPADAGISSGTRWRVTYPIFDPDSVTMQMLPRRS
jgi:hypothetical protein